MAWETTSRACDLVLPISDDAVMGNEGILFCTSTVAGNASHSSLHILLRNVYDLHGSKKSNVLRSQEKRALPLKYSRTSFNLTESLSQAQICLISERCAVCSPSLIRRK